MMAAIATTKSELIPSATQLAEALRLPLTSINDVSYPLLIILSEAHLALHDRSEPNLKPIYVDFVHGAVGHRQQYGGGRRQLIARAMGLKAKKNPTVLDVTAGLGEDAFILATLGCQVTMLERHPIIAALLADGLQRAKASPHLQTLALTLIHADAKVYLPLLTAATKPEVIYLDPMFPTANKSALVKKPMRILRRVVGDDLDTSALLPLALQYAQKRVVVKRTRHAPPLDGPTPNVVFTGKSTRFDVYVK